MIFLGADHRGYELKERLKKHLHDEGFEITDLGNDHLDPQDDYVDFARQVADAVAQDPQNRGVLLCGSGVGVDIVANKVDGVRSALVSEEALAIQSRRDDDANVVALPADVLDEEQAFRIIKAFLTTEFSGLPRHERRLEKLDEVEAKHK